MKVKMHELDHCPNCKVVTRVIESRFGDDVDIEHEVMTQAEVDDFVSRGLTTSPVVEVDGNYYTASTREDRNNLLETLEIMRSHTNI